MFVRELELSREHEIFPMTVKIEGPSEEANPSNDAVTRYFAVK